jgi:hypothetical protein
MSRKLFEPTSDQRNQVKIMVGLGIPQDKICLTIINPETGKPLSKPTLERSFKREIEIGATEMHTLVGNMIVNTILGRKPAIGEPIKNDQSRITAAIFYAKTKMGWKDTTILEHTARDGAPLQITAVTVFAQMIERLADRMQPKLIEGTDLVLSVPKETDESQN